MCVKLLLLFKKIHNSKFTPIATVKFNDINDQLMSDLSYEVGKKRLHAEVEETENSSMNVAHIEDDQQQVHCDSRLLERIINDKDIARDGQIYDRIIQEGLHGFHWLKVVIHETKIFLSQSICSNLRRELEDNTDPIFVTHSTSSIDDRPTTSLDNKNDNSTIIMDVEKSRAEFLEMWQPLWDYLLWYYHTRSVQTRMKGTYNVQNYDVTLQQFPPVAFEHFHYLCRDRTFIATCPPPELHMDPTKIDTYDRQPRSELVNKIFHALYIHNDIIHETFDEEESKPISIFESVSLLMHLVLCSSDLDISLLNPCITLVNIAAFFGGVLFSLAGLPFTFEQALCLFTRPDMVSLCSSDIDRFAVHLVDQLIGRWLKNKASTLNSCQARVHFIRSLLQTCK